MMRRKILLGSVLLALILVVLSVVVLGGQHAMATMDSVESSDADEELMSLASDEDLTSLANRARMEELSSVDAFMQELESINEENEQFDWTSIDYANISYG